MVDKKLDRELNNKTIENNVDYKKALNKLIKNMDNKQIEKLYKKALYIIYKK